MSVAEPTIADGEGVTDGQVREAARETWLAAREAGAPMSGAELGRAFGRTDRWGRKQIAAARHSTTGERNDPPGTAHRPRPDSATDRNAPGPERPASSRPTTKTTPNPR